MAPEMARTRDAMYTLAVSQEVSEGSIVNKCVSTSATICVSDNGASNQGCSDGSAEIVCAGNFRGKRLH